MKRFFLLALAAVAIASCGPKEYVFIQMSDPQVGFKDTTEAYAQSDSLMKLAVGAANRIKPAAVIVTGDLVNNTADELQKEVYKRNIAAIDKGIEFFALPGNHDMRPWTEENHKAFIEFNGYDRFYKRIGDDAFIGFDSCCIKDGIKDQETEQLDWLIQTLERCDDARYIFLFTHCPIFREDIDEEEDYFNFSREKRKEYLELFDLYEVDAVFAGHTHKDCRSSYKGIQLITAGPVGSPLHGGFSGINVVRVTPDGFSAEFVSAPEAK